LTQSGLAKAAGVSQSLVAKIESGRVSASYANVKSLFGALDSKEREARPSVKAGQFMRRGVKFVHASDSVEAAARFLRRGGFSQAPVLDGERIVGGVTESLFLEAVAAGRVLSGARVSEVMGECFPQVSPETPFATVAELLKFSPAVLVARKGAIEGIITKSDALAFSRGA
jgi:predicted transcriptional regulator